MNNHATRGAVPLEANSATSDAVRGEASNATPGTVLQEVSEWRQRGAELRTKLLEERVVLVARLQEVDTALAAIPDSTPQAQTEVGLLDENISVPALVRYVMTKHHDGINALDIIREVRKVRPAVDVKAIHSAISRLVKTGIIVSRGKRGARQYRLTAGTKMETMAEKGHRRANNSQESSVGRETVDPKSLTGQAMAVLREAHQQFLHVDEIETRLKSRGVTVKKFILVGTLTRLAKQGYYFVKGPLPNTFGLR